MKFRKIQPYSPPLEVEEYLTNTLRLGLLDLITGLQSLDFLDNFEAFEYEGTIEAGTEVEIRNQLIKVIPSSRLIVRHSGDPSVVDGDTEWNENFVYLKNSGSSAATVKVIFLR